MVYAFYLSKKEPRVWDRNVSSFWVDEGRVYIRTEAHPDKTLQEALDDCCPREGETLMNTHDI